MTTIGKYQVLDTIGSGGFAVVYKGFDPDIKRLVAIKVCASNDKEVRARFYHEAEIAGRLSHRNITPIYEFGVFLQTPYLVEEYLPGIDLAKLIRRQEPTQLAEKIDIFLQVSGGLAYAHRKGVLHRDVKPANVRVLDDGQVKILDFGTAKVLGTQSDLTQSGMTLGTVAFMAPERLRGEPGTASADVFSLGALAFELFTFARAFDAGEIVLVINQVLDESAPPLVERWPDCPPGLAAIVDRALAHDAQDRYPSAVELLADLESFRDAWLATLLPTEAPAPTAEIPALIARIESLLEAGRSGRARLLLEEALEMAPTDGQVRRLAADLGMAARASPPAGPEEPRVEAAGDSATSPAFTGLALDRAPHSDPENVREAVDALRQAVITIRHEALRQAHRVSLALRHLDTDAELDPELAAHLAERAEDLAPGRTAALRIAEERKHRVRPVDDRDRGGEATASIESLLDTGETDKAADALRFALDMLGPFDGSERLARRIDDKRRGR